jgi:hypothetical protein
VPPVALENPEDRVQSTLGRTHNRIRSRWQTASGQWNNVGKGSGQNGSVTSEKGLALRSGLWGSRPQTCRLPAACSSCSRGESGLPRHAHEWINEIPTVPVYYPVKPQPRERAWRNQRGKKTLLSLTLLRLERCRISGSLRVQVKYHYF